MKKFVLIFLFFLQLNLFAQSKSNNEISIAGTFMVESDNLFLEEANRHFYVGDAFLGKAEFDYFFDTFSKNFGIGFYVNIGSPWYDGNGETFMVEFGPSVKWRIDLNKVVVVPAIYIGYRSYEDPAGEGLGLNLSIKAQFPQDTFIPFIDVGFLSQPVGGNDDTDATFSPVLIFGAGVGFAL
jgi:hypothetical protein